MGETKPVVVYSRGNVKLVFSLFFIACWGFKPYTTIIIHFVTLIFLILMLFVSLNNQKQRVQQAAVPAHRFRVSGGQSLSHAPLHMGLLDGERMKTP